jgi:hypothetical protein
MNKQLGVSLKGESDAAKQAFHFGRFLKGRGEHIVPPSLKLRVDAVKGRARDHVLRGDRNQVALHVVHLLGVDLKEVRSKALTHPSAVFLKAEACGMENGVTS